MDKKIIVALIALAVVMFPSWSFAETLPVGEAEIRAKIATLLSKVSLLQNELDTLKATGENERISQTYHLIGTLEKGMRNDDVMTLQSLLAKDMQIYPEGYVTGYYGTLTSAAVERFKNKYNEPTLTVESVGTPRISAIAATSTDTTMTIVWKTDVPTTAKIWWGAPGPLDPILMTPISTMTLSKDHSARFAGTMYASTTYAFIISATDENGNTSMTEEQNYVRQ